MLIFGLIKCGIALWKSVFMLCNVNFGVPFSKKMYFFYCFLVSKLFCIFVMQKINGKFCYHLETL